MTAAPHPRQEPPFSVEQAWLSPLPVSPHPGNMHPSSRRGRAVVVLKRLLGLCPALAGAALVCTAGPSHAAAPTPDSVIAEINRMRADPQGFAQMLERLPRGP